MQDYHSFKSLYPSINMGKYHKRVPKVIECEPTVVQTRQGPRLVDRVIPSTPSISSAHSSPSKKRALSPTPLYADDLPDIFGPPHTSKRSRASERV
jgi:hypothetical protein